MTLKIERVYEKGRTRICVSGELRSTNLDDMRAEIARAVPPVILDLGEVDLVDVDAIRWLNACQTQGVQVENCEPYVREWMFQEKLGEEK